MQRNRSAKEQGTTCWAPIRLLYLIRLLAGLADRANAVITYGFEAKMTTSADFHALIQS